MSTTVTVPVERALWLTLPGAPTRIAVGWLAWVAIAGLGASMLSPLFGPAGVLVVLAVGWLLARRGVVPSDCLRRHHLDDLELTVVGPGRRVRRLAWSAIVGLTQEQRVLRLETRDVRIALPLAPLVSTAGWNALLTRVVAGLAAEMWALVEDGEVVQLRTRPSPSLRALAWWAYAPAAAGVAFGGGAPGLVLALGAALAERLVAVCRSRVGEVALGSDGLTVRRRARQAVVPWDGAEVIRAPQGLFVTTSGGGCDVVASRLQNFWAAAPVIETKAQLGPYSAPVSFRVRVAGGTLAVVGEVDPAA